MHKERDPLTYAWAAARVIELVGAKRAAAAIERSPSLIYQWSDEDNPAQPVMWQAQALDDYCAAESGERPFSLVWQTRIGLPRPSDDCPMHLATEVNVEVARLLAEMNEALADARIDNRERNILNDCIAKIYRRLPQLQANVTAIHEAA